MDAHVPGYYLFSAPWETTRDLLERFNNLQRYSLQTPSSYAGPNQIYTISITPAGNASLTSYDANLRPTSDYPVLDPAPLTPTACSIPPFAITAVGPSSGISQNETVYFIRHANAHPSAFFSDVNYVAAGQWRALDLVHALSGKVSPSHVYSLDPAQVTQAAFNAAGRNYWSHNTLWP